MAARLAPGDTQRILRALEVVEATGVSLAEWQSRPGTPLVPVAEAECIVVGMPRPELHRRADQRLDQMIAAGAVDEVAALVARRLPPDRPALRALGVAPLAAHLAGRVTLADALAAAKLETRQYIKRQETWLRKNMISWKWSEKKE
jgi:tRNA dimethylallyltransferase